MAGLTGLGHWCQLDLKCNKFDNTVNNKMNNTNCTTTTTNTTRASGSVLDHSSQPPVLESNCGQI